MAVLQNEKEIRDTRGKVADDSISQLKNYYGKLKDMANQAYEEQKKVLEKEHQTRMDNYDAEIDKVNELYDARFKEMDANKAQVQYEEGLAEKNKQKSDLTNKISLLSRDTSLEGKKKLAEYQSQLDALNKEIAQYQADRQDELYRQQLEEQKQATIDALNAQKEQEQTSYDAQVTDLTNRQDATNKQYDDIINNDEYWANLKKAFENGDFSGIQQEMAGMQTNLLAMSAGTFDGISQDFVNFSDTAKKAVAELNKLDVSNLLYALEAVNGSVDDLAHAEAIDFTNGEVSSAGVGGTTESTWNYVAPTPAPTTSQSQPNPTPAPEPRYYTVKKGDTLWDLAQSYYGNPLRWTSIASANGITNARRLQIGQRLLIPFRSGGYTGDWSGDDGRLAVLHKKELVLNQKQTKDILNTAKIVDKIKKFIPDVKRASISDKLATAGTITTNISYGDINVTVEGGDKKKANDIAKEILNGMKKRGK
jgi:nucleoid-associated protein YgaU